MMFLAVRACMPIVLLLCVLRLSAQPVVPVAAVSAPTAEAMAADLFEEVHRIPVRLTDLYGRTDSALMPLTLYRPAEPGPHPLVIFNHGRASGAARAKPLRQRFEVLARYLVNKGFVVLVPTRIGYGETYGGFDAETAGTQCERLQFDAMARVASDQVLATLEWARQRPEIDTQRWLVMGISVGGLTSVATVWRQPPGLLGGVNFSGGSGGDPERSPGRPCSPQRMAQLFQEKGALAQVPMQWLYWENDLFWGAEHPKTWFQAWTRAGAPAEFTSLPPVGKDGHSGLNIDMNHWVPVVDAFLARLGFDRPGWPPRPPVNPTVKVDEVDKVPVPDANRALYASKFLTSPLPRAFAFSPSGSVGWASGDWAAGRALGYCQSRRGVRCSLYAVDQDVVWP